VLTVAEDGVTVAAGAVASTTGVLTVGEDELTVAAGGAASTAGVLTVAEDGLTVAVGGVASTAGVLTVAMGAAAAATQCSEIMFSPVTTKLLSAAPELAVPLAFCPMSATSWPRCALKSMVLLVILSI